jgi:hypothetical protein
MSLAPMIYSWSDEKNTILKKQRGISFEEIVVAILNGQILDVLEHPNKQKYPNQKLYVVEYQGYAYAVPYVEQGEGMFLKTIYPMGNLSSMPREMIESQGFLLFLLCVSVAFFRMERVP